MKFEFETDEESAQFCHDIVHTMGELFGIPEAEALGRLNRHWRGIPFTGPNDITYHETSEYWAMTIYYGKRSYWWLNPPGLKPLPYP